ncbi:MAG: MFS transporter [Verrucomicrobia bacterium]|nr:MFS transporter [Verrucomicrobiota bacterium]
MLKGLSRHSFLAVTIGGALEWYEFSIYMFLAPVLAKHYFSALPGMKGVLLIALIFALGFLSRPFGGLIFGHIGDRYGRKIALLISIISITIPTFGIGFLPNSSEVLVAPFLLLLLRLLQGAITGGELPGIICYLTEGIPPKNSRFISSLSFFGSQLGMIVGIIECLLLELMVSPAQFVQWGWRISFLLSGLIGLTGLFLRSRLKETRTFTTLSQHKHVSKRPILQSFLSHKKKIVIGILLTALPLAAEFLLLGLSQIYIQESLHLSPFAALGITGILLLVTAVSMPYFGKLGDRYPNKRILKLCSVGLILISYPLYHAAAHLSPFAAPLAVATCLILSCNFSLIPFALAELFPTSVRYSCIGLSYNLSASIFGGTAPFVALLLIRQTHHVGSPCLILISTGLLSLIGISLLKDKKAIA